MGATRQQESFNRELRHRTRNLVAVTGSHLPRAQPGLEAVDVMFDPKGVWCEMLIVGAPAASQPEMA